MIAKNMSFKEIEDNLDKVAILPLGSTEQHGPYLPIGTDAIIAEEVAIALEKKIPNKVIVYPVLSFGCAKEHVGFAGSVYFEFETYLKLIGEIVQSIFASGFKNILILNGHGGNNQILQVAQAKWNYGSKSQKLHYHFAFSKGVEELALKLFGEMEHHAGSVETSIVYSISDEYVKTNKKSIKNNDFKLTKSKSFSLHSTSELGESGVVAPSDTLNFSVSKGQKIFKKMVEDAVKAIEEIKT